MYTAALVALLVVAARFIVGGVRRRSRARILLGSSMAIATLGAFGLLSFWGEMLWFEEVGFLGRFWTEAAATAGVAAIGAALAAGLVALITWPTRRTAKLARRIGMSVAAVLGAMWGASSWSLVLRWALRVRTDMTEPILGWDTGFYLFTLPAWEAIAGWLITVAVLLLVLAVTIYLRVFFTSWAGVAMRPSGVSTTGRVGNSATAHAVA